MSQRTLVLQLPPARGRDLKARLSSGDFDFRPAPYALFSANRSKEFADISYAAEQAMMAVAVEDPTVGLYSATALSQGILAQDALYAGVSEIVQSRRPVSDLDGLVAEWRNRLGSKMGIGDRLSVSAEGVRSNLCSAEAIEGGHTTAPAVGDEANSPSRAVSPKRHHLCHQRATKC